MSTDSEQRSREFTGTIELIGERIVQRSSEGDWDLYLGDLALIGEYTNCLGPFTDDWFLVFFRRGNPNKWLEASMYAAIKTKFLEELERVLGTKLSSELVGSAVWATNVIWPPRLAGRPLFETRRVAEPGLRGFVERKLGMNLKTYPTPEVIDCVGGTILL